VTCWIVGIVAAMLTFASLGSYLYHRLQLDTLAANHVRLMVMGPAELHAGTAAEYEVRLTDVAGEPLPALIEMSLYSANGKRLLGQMDRTEQQDRLRLRIPADMALPTRRTSSVRLKVIASRSGKREELETMLAVRPTEYATRLMLDKLEYRSGETVYYRSVSLSLPGSSVDRPLPIGFEILDPQGNVVEGSRIEGVTDHGVGNGVFPIPKDFPQGRYTLVARSLDGAFTDEKTAFSVIRSDTARLNIDLETFRNRYQPGETVRAALSVCREGGGPAEVPLEITLTSGGQEILRKKGQTSPDGFASIEFALPKKIVKDDVKVAITADDRGARRTLTASIPTNIGPDAVSVLRAPRSSEEH